MPSRSLVTSYDQDLNRFEDRWQLIGLGVLLVILVAWPAVVPPRWVTIAVQACTAIVGALSLMILTGFAGQISLGHAGFLAVGAYTAAMLGVHGHVPFWLCMPVSGLVAAGLGLLVGPFALRLRGLYLAIVTLGLLFVVDHVLLSLPEWSGGVSGTTVPMHLWFTDPASGSGQYGRFDIGVDLTFSQRLYVLYVPLAVAATLFSQNVRRSRLGRSMIAVRDSDLAATALGIRPARAKVTAFVISSFMAGVAGSMFAFQQQYLTVHPPFDLNMSVQYIAMIVLGGVGTVFGGVAGAVAFVLLSPLAEMLGRNLPLLSGLSSAQQSTIMFSTLVIVVLVVEPLGLYGVWLRVKRYFVAWPFRY
ncbi:MAG: branched-chain amino acid ABC transporter permease [Myxococcales bacterium]|nr:branched-chain amino acid ABC transporter permease [Myxococcales bacterium]